MSPEIAEKQDETAERLDRRDGIPTTPTLPNAGINNARTTPLTDKKKKDRNWIRISDDGKSTADQDERKPSGWGWLADDVQSQKEEKDAKDGKSDKKKDDDTSENSDETLAETVTRKTDAADAKREAANTFTPVDTDKLLKDVRPIDVAQKAGAENSRGTSTPNDTPSTSTRDPNAASSSPDQVPTVTDVKSGVDTMWNSDRSWGPRTESASALPMASRALSDPSRSSPGSLAQPMFTPSGYQGPTPSSFLVKTPLSAAPASTPASPFSPAGGISTPSAPGGFGGFSGFGTAPAGGTVMPMEPIKPLQPSKPLSDAFLK